MRKSHGSVPQSLFSEKQRRILLLAREYGYPPATPDIQKKTGLTPEQLESVWRDICYLLGLPGSSGKDSFNVILWLASSYLK